MDHSHHNHHILNETTKIPLSDNSIASSSMVHHHQMHSQGDSMQHSSGHAMTFHFGHNQTLFFNAWQISTPMTLIYACVGIFITSVLYEGLKVFREHFMSNPIFGDPNNNYGNSPRRRPWCLFRLRNALKLSNKSRKKVTLTEKDLVTDVTRHKKGCCALKNNKSALPSLNCGGSSQTSPNPGEDENQIDTPYVKINDESSRIETPEKGNVYSEFNVHGFKSCDCRSSPAFSLPDHVIQSIFHMVQTCLGFLLMLVFMTFNVWLCAALIAGAGVGYFCFAWKRRIAIVDVTQHCN